MDLEIILKEYRSIKSKELNVPAYIIFSNSVIHAICEVVPQSLSEILEIKGIGKVKAERYGEDLLEMCLGIEPLPVNAEQIIEARVSRPISSSQITSRPRTAPKETVVNMNECRQLNIDLQLSDKQKEVITSCDKGENVFITGPGGTGKSALIRIILNRYQITKNTHVCALTGVAAELLGCNATTIHSWSGSGISYSGTDQIIRNILRKKRLVDNWKNIEVLIIDEVSMMSKKYFDILDAIGRNIRNNDEPFGGIQLIFSGDFHQLPPVGRETDPDSCKFCFESLVWKDTFPNVIILKQIFRQIDPQFMKILQQVRKGAISENTYNILKSRILTKDGLSYDKDITPPIITPRKTTVELINNMKMKQLPGQIYTYKMNIYNTKKDSSGYLSSEEKLEVKEVKKRMNAEETLILKLGARVMCISNLDMVGIKQIVNGSQGIVEDFTSGYPVVRFKNGLRKVIKNHSFAGENIKHIGVKQLPLILSWAITIHKSQGITLDTAIIDAGDDIFGHGQTYVAFSRVKSLQGLFLQRFNHMKISTNPKVTKYYDSINSSV